jgi:hypothetical protein
MILPRFTWWQSGLRLADEPGERAFLSASIMFSKQTLARTKLPGFGLVLYDECFHSTNPPDGERSPRKYF